MVIGVRLNRTTPEGYAPEDNDVPEYEKVHEIPEYENICTQYIRRISVDMAITSPITSRTMPLGVIQREISSSKEITLS